MDALPINEPVRVAVRLEVSGKDARVRARRAHGDRPRRRCRCFPEMRDDMRGRVMFVFQPAEETLTGAAAMLEAARSRIPRPTRSRLSQLAAASHRHGGWHPDAVMASSDRFDVTIKGVGGHGAHPHLAVDSIVGAAQFVNQLQTIVSREIAPISSAVVTIGQMRAGRRETSSRHRSS
jgi:metal-dependent amidase/aminoacylase/carboxypeptidase family protein